MSLPEYPRDFNGELRYEIKNFSGEVLCSGSDPVSLSGISSKRICKIPYQNISSRDVYLKTTLWSGDELIDEKLYLLVPDKEASLPKVQIQHSTEIRDGKAIVTLRSDCFARYVYVDSDLVWENWSDNYFDLEPGCEKVLSVELKDISLEALESSLQIKSLTDVEPVGTQKDDRKYLKEMWKKDNNWATYYAYKLVMAILWFQSIGD